MRKIQGVELCQIVEILDLADKVVMQVQAPEFTLIFQIGNLAYTVVLQPQTLETCISLETLDKGES